MNLIFDTETTGKPRSYRAPFDDVDAWPRLVQIAWMQAGGQRDVFRTGRVATIRPDGFLIPAGSTAIHGISDAIARETGEELADVLAEFCRDIQNADTIVGHNLDFDVPVVAAELCRLGYRCYADALANKTRYDTMRVGTNVCKIPGKYGDYKFPSLGELYQHLFGRQAENLHRADGDVQATAECYFELRRRADPGEDDAE